MTSTGWNASMRFRSYAVTPVDDSSFGDDIGDELSEVELLRVGSRHAGVELGEEQQLVHQLNQPAGIAVDSRDGRSELVGHAPKTSSLSSSI